MSLNPRYEGIIYDTIRGREIFSGSGDRIGGWVKDGVKDGTEEYLGKARTLYLDLNFEGTGAEEYALVYNAINGADKQNQYPRLITDLAGMRRADESGSGYWTYTPYTQSQAEVRAAGAIVSQVEQATAPTNSAPISLSGGSTPSGLSTLVSRLGLVAVAAIATPAVIIGLYLWYNRSGWRKALWSAAGLFALVAIGGGYLVYYLLTSYAGIYRG